ncbi:DNA recombination protein RmuC [Chelatococcus sambhunathii]|uniref:DNA recombination protein RmuC homolog n=1 Tax=Chelatococcus sambhunathii TaxID=363953 RepID=A0ABU1DIW0_9HYPH|nr:DNA recombination protein RmuC [Chelatococcus sambhunathii]MDR4308066.1 DNA recombination protein RmuC [Chelatococcus sambhunathii]
MAKDVLFQLGGVAVTPAEAMVALAFACVAALTLVLLVLIGSNAARRREAREAAYRAQEAEERLAGLERLQAEATGRLQAFAVALGQRQSDLARGVSERLDAVGARIGDGLSAGGQATAEQLKKLEARLAVIDAAGASIGALAGQVTDLKAILANKPARGAFGQGRMEAILKDALPPSACTFQAQLSTGVRPDALIRLPGDPRPLAVDAKFPLEGFERLRLAETPEALKAAEAKVRADVGRHASDIAQKYLVAGETQDVALLFVPSEQIHAELAERFDDVVARAQRARVLIVSPSLLMLAVQIVQGLTRDAAMREQGRLIQTEVGRLLEDVRRIGERVEKLKSHFGQVAGDLDQIAISTEKVTRRGMRLEQLELGEADTPTPILPFRGEAAE